MNPDSTFSIWFRGVEIGAVTLAPTNAEDNHFGMLRPTTAYWEHRPVLQTLTLGMANLTDASPERIAAAVSEALNVVRAGGLELHDETGNPVSASLLIIADCGPAELPSDVRDRMPIIVHARFGDAMTIACAI